MNEANKNKQRSRAWCFTINNPDELVDAGLNDLGMHEGTKYMVCQREVAPTSLTPHIQGYIYFEHLKSFHLVKSIELFHKSKAHLEAALGNPQQNRDYCSKSGGTELREWGTMPTKGSRSDLKKIAISIIDKSKTIDNIVTENPDYFVKYHKGLTALQSAIMPARSVDVQPQVHWWFGPTGTGKSRKAWEEFPGAYWKMSDNKWWDGYRGETAIVIDDYRIQMCPFDYLLRLLDRYPMIVEIKGGTVPLAGTTWVITAPARPEVLWRYRTEEAINQLLRRITSILQYSTDGSRVCLKSCDVVYVPEEIDRSPEAIANSFNAPNNRFK